MSTALELLFKLLASISTKSGTGAVGDGPEYDRVRDILRVLTLSTSAKDPSFFLIFLPTRIFFNFLYFFSGANLSKGAGQKTPQQMNGRYKDLFLVIDQYYTRPQAQPHAPQCQFRYSRSVAKSILPPSQQPTGPSED